MAGETLPLLFYDHFRLIGGSIYFSNFLALKGASC